MEERRDACGLLRQRDSGENEASQNVSSDLLPTTRKAEEEGPPAEEAKKPNGTTDRKRRAKGAVFQFVGRRRVFPRQHGRAVGNRKMPTDEDEEGEDTTSGGSRGFRTNGAGGEDLAGDELCGAARAGEAGAVVQTTQRSGAAEGDVACRECGKGFAWRSSLNTHQRLHAGEKLFGCQTCGRSFSQKPNLLCHLRSHTFQCARCERSFCQKQHLGKHLRTHLRAQPSPQACPECQRSFGNKAVLRLHRRLHARQRQVVFKELKAAYQERVARQREEAVRPKGRRRGVKKFICSECGKGFTWWSSLSIHQRIHTGEKPFPCAQCGKSFTQKPNLLRHLRYHSGERPHACAECGKGFTQKQHLLKHQRTHGTEKGFQCHACGKTFPSKGSLTVHQRAGHGGSEAPAEGNGEPFALGTPESLEAAVVDSLIASRQGLFCPTELSSPQGGDVGDGQPVLIVEPGTRPLALSQTKKGVFWKPELPKPPVPEQKQYICNECGKGFVSWSALTIHRRIHTGERPYPCGECGKRFSQKPNLVRHQRYHTGEKPYPCAECGKCFVQKHHLTKHQRVHSKDPPLQGPAPALKMEAR